MESALLVLGFLACVALYRLVSRDEVRRERTATPELWARTLDYWKSHNTKPASRDGLTGLSSRIADFPATTNSNAAPRI